MPMPKREVSRVVRVPVSLYELIASIKKEHKANNHKVIESIQKVLDKSTNKS